MMTRAVDRLRAAEDEVIGIAAAFLYYGIVRIKTRGLSKEEARKAYLEELAFFGGGPTRGHDDRSHR